MPLYDYKCEACGSEFEVERPLTAKGAVKCACGSSRTSKIFSAAGIVFKGSGFYVTDSKSKSETAAEARDKPDATKPAQSESSDSKPAESKAVETSSTKPKAPAKSGGE